MPKTTVSLRTGSKLNHKIVTTTTWALFGCFILLVVWGLLISIRSLHGDAKSKLFLTQRGLENRFSDANSHSTVDHEDHLIVTQAKLIKISNELSVFQQFKEEVSLATQNIDNSNSIFLGTVESLSSFHACLSMTYLILKDVISGSSEASDFFNDEVEEFDRITELSVQGAKEAIDRLAVSLQIVENSYPESLVVGPEIVNLQTTTGERDLQRAHAEKLTHVDLTKSISLGSSVGSIGAVVSASALTKSVNRGANIWGLMAKRSMKKLGTGALLVFLDGPLPFGDVAAVVLESICFAWSFHEVYVAQGVLKDQMQFQLASVRDQNLQRIREWAMTVGNEMMSAAVISASKPVECNGPNANRNYYCFDN